MRWQDAGAPRLHVIDLDGAFTGEPVNLKTVEKIVSVIKIPVQLGGGVRNIETIKKVLDTGVERVILGTAAIENTKLITQAFQIYGEAIIIGVDARNGNVSIKGWQETSEIEAESLIKHLVDLGALRFICTDINKDGTLKGPNYAALARVKKAVSLPIIAAGGVASIEHLKKLASMGLEGAIIGKALYTGSIDLKQALIHFSSKNHFT